MKRYRRCGIWALPQDEAPDGQWVSYEEASARIAELEKAMKWVIEDIAFKPPEQAASASCEWWNRLRDALESKGL